MRSLISLAPVALLANRRTREFYVHNRQTLLAFTQLASAQWQLHVQHYMRTMEAATFTRPLYIHGFSWLGVVILLFQYRIRMAAPIAMLCFALDTTLIPQICRIFYQDMGMARCVAGDLARILPLVLLGPLAVAWAVERHARRRVFTTT